MTDEQLLKFAQEVAAKSMAEVSFDGNPSDPCSNTVSANFHFPSYHVRNAAASGNREPLETVVKYAVQNACMGAKAQLSLVADGFSPRRYHIDIYPKPEEDREIVVVLIDGIRRVT